MGVLPEQQHRNPKALHAEMTIIFFWDSREGAGVGCDVAYTIVCKRIVEGMSWDERESRVVAEVACERDNNRWYALKGKE